ncbi:MAG: L-fuculose-phosphate aldolase [Planctomycetota bacterium]|jgi:L-fuculose-phosphate aldolase
MTNSNNELLDELIVAAEELVSTGLVTGAGGNISVSDGTWMWISPSGFSLSDAGPEHYPRISVETGEIDEGDYRPSSEVLMHLWTYRVRPELRAIVHAHPKMTNALSSAGQDLKPIFPDYYVYLGKNVPHLPYVTVTTPELAEVVRDAFEAPNCYGMVLRNHGTITVGTSVKEALFRTLAMEEQAFIQYHAQTVGTPNFLSEAECLELDGLGSEEYRRKLLADMKATGGATASGAS